MAKKLARKVKIYGKFERGARHSQSPDTGYIRGVLVTVADPDLSQALCVHAVLMETWQDAAREVMMLLQLLHTAAPTLADVVALGLIALAASPATRSALVLQYRRVSVVARGLREDGSEVEAAHDHPMEVTHLEVQEIQVAALAKAA